jgi:hypothetical protein
MRCDGHDMSRADMAQLVVEYQRGIDPGRLYQLATSLGMSVGSLVSI